MKQILEGKSRATSALEKCKQSPVREFNTPLKLEIKSIIQPQTAADVELNKEICVELAIMPQ